MKKITIIITAALLTAALPMDRAKADNPGTLVNDVNFDGVINAVDASMVLTEYARTSSGYEPTFSRTQTFVADTDRDGQPLNYQALTVEGAQDFIDLIRKDDEQYMIIADMTIYADNIVSKATYIVN